MAPILGPPRPWPCCRRLQISPVRHASATRGKAGWRNWEQLLEERKKDDYTAYRKQTTQVQIDREQRQLYRQQAELKWGKAPLVTNTSIDLEKMSGPDAAKEFTKINPIISPGIIQPWGLVLSDQWEGVPARLGRCVQFGCVTPEQTWLAAQISREWGAHWADILAGLNNTVIGANWEPPADWIRERRGDYAPAHLGHGDMVAPFADIAPTPTRPAAPVPEADELIKYHVWAKPHVPTLRYQGVRQPRGEAPVVKQLSVASVGVMVWYKNRWVRHWLPHSAGSSSRSPPGKMRALMVPEDLPRPMTHRISSSIHIDPSWRTLYRSIPELDDHIGWDRFARRLLLLQNEWATGSPDLIETVPLANRLPFLTLTVLHSMQSQSIFARVLHESPSASDAGRPLINPHLLRWQAIAASLVIERDKIQRCWVDDRQRRPWQTSKVLGSQVAAAIDKVIPLLGPALAQAEADPDGWSDSSGDHPALDHIRDELSAVQASRDMMRCLNREALTGLKAQTDVRLKFTLQYERLRMRAVAERVTWRLAVQDEAVKWARSRAETALARLGALEEMTWKKAGAEEVMGV